MRQQSAVHNLISGANHQKNVPGEANGRWEGWALRKVRIC